MTAEELLQRIQKQIVNINMKRHHHPKLTIWMHSEDIETILKSKNLANILPDIAHTSRRGRYPTKLMGETLIVSDDIVVGQPTVEGKYT